MHTDVQSSIARAFWTLSQTKSIDKITVKDLVEGCGISRQTFYYHFQDLMDVVEWSMRQNMERLVEKSIPVDSLEERLALLIRALQTQQTLYDRLMDSQHRDQAERLMVDIIYTYLARTVEEKDLLRDVRRGDLKTALTFYAYGILGMVLSERQKSADPALLARQFAQLIRGDLLPAEEL